MWLEEWIGSSGMYWQMEADVEGLSPDYRGNPILNAGVSNGVTKDMTDIKPFL